MALWTSSADSGILRKNKHKENHEELLVFGYACKLFRDDEKALYIDKGKHLIPWMNDDNLKIDRYDCRGALSDLTAYEASREGFDTMRWLGLNENERKLEELCDKERYYSLHINEEEEEMYKEEERKRAQTNAIQYSYDVPQEPIMNPTKNDDDDEEFVPNPDLSIPDGVIIPKTMKENRRIEKTAIFVSKQGPQMEILIKAKQSDNPQFAFLNQTDSLNKYYKFILTAIKNGQYFMHTKSDEKNGVESVGDEHYLHPSLLSASDKNLDVKHGLQLVDDAVQSDVRINPDTLTDEQRQQYYQYCYAMRYYEYYQKYQQDTVENRVRPLETPSMNDGQMSTTTTTNAISNPYAQIVSNVNKDLTNPYSNLMYVTKSTANEMVPIKPLTLLTEYGSGSDSDASSDNDNNDETIKKMKKPPDEMMIVIEKMASYVMKNGEQFEEIVRSKGDPRFVFLDSKHEFYPIYRKTLETIRQKTDEQRVVQMIEPPKLKEKKIIAPVSFSIKKTKEEPPKEIKSALPVEESDEDVEAETIESDAVLPTVELSTDSVTTIANPIKSGIFDGDDPILEMIDLTEEEERKDARRAEDKIKDKLAAAAREKLASVARDRALQLERKRKAAAFLKLKSYETIEKSKNDDNNDEKSIESTIDEKKVIIFNKKSDTIDKDVRTVKKISKKKKSHKRKHSKSRHESKKSKKKRHRTNSSTSSES